CRLCYADTRIEVFDFSIKNRRDSAIVVCAWWAICPFLPILRRVRRGTKSRIEDSHMPRKVQYLVLCLLLSSAFSSCSQLARSEPTRESRESGANAGADKAVTVAVARIERKDLSQGLTLAAEFRPFQEIDLHAKVAGYLREINVDVGDRVRQGQVIATL